MALFGLIGRNRDRELRETITQLQTQLQWLASTRNIYPLASVKDAARKYATVDDLYSIVRLIATTAAMIPGYGYKVKSGKQASKARYTDAFQQKMIQSNRLDELPDTDKFAQFMKAPYYGMTKFEGDMAKNICLLLHGEYFLYKQVPELGPDRGKVTALHLWLPQHVQLKVSDTFPFKVLGYDYIVDGVSIMENVPFTDVIHVKYFNPELSITGNELRGLSPVKVLTNRMMRVENNLAVSNAQMQNGGVPGIAYVKGMDSMGATGASESHKQNFYNYLTKKENKGAPYFSGNEFGYVPLGLPLADLQIAELEKIDFKKLCNVYGVSDVLFNNDAASTDNNTQWASKRLYTNTVLPMLYMDRDAVNASVVPHFGSDYFYDIDITEVPELQGDMKAMADTFAALPVMIPNDILEAFNYGRVDDPMMDQPYIKSGYIPALESEQPLPITGDYGNNRGNGA
jgi:HK97 family phage portal protein